MTSFPSLSCLSCLLIIFAAANITLSIASHNLHGFKKSSAFHKQCLETYGGVWLGQNLVPRKSFVSTLRTQRSVCRPLWDGRRCHQRHHAWETVWRSQHSVVARSRSRHQTAHELRHKRSVAVEVETKPYSLLLLSIYIADTVDVISMLEEIVSNHPLHNVIIGGDFNTELNGFFSL